MRPIAKFLLCLVVLTNLSCSVNILESFADKTTNESLYVEAQKLVSAGQYSAALEKIALMTGSFTSDRKVVNLSATAHAGLCGLDFFNFILALNNLGSNRLLPFLMGHFRSGSTVAQIDQCILAENLIEGIGAIGSRTTDENLLLALISFAKIGNLLSYYADVDQDGTATSAYDVCTAGGARTAGATMPDSDAREFGSGITLALANINAVSGQVSVASAPVAVIDSACSSLGGANFCGKTDPTSFTAGELLAIRSFAKEGSAVGLDLQTCSGGDLSQAACRCF